MEPLIVLTNFFRLVHIGIAHFVFNMLMQIIVGVSLEMAQEGWMGSVRVAVVYMSGVIAGINNKQCHFGVPIDRYLLRIWLSQCSAFLTFFSIRSIIFIRLLKIVACILNRLILIDNQLH